MHDRSDHSTNTASGNEDLGSLTTLYQNSPGQLTSTQEDVLFSAARLSASWAARSFDYTYGLGDSMVEPEDVAQEAMVKLIRKMQSGGVEDVEALSYVIGRNEARTVRYKARTNFRGSDTRESVDDENTEASHVVSDSGSSAEDAAVINQEASRLANSIPRQNRRAVVLPIIGFGSNEIAEMEDLTQAGVRTRRHRGLSAARYAIDSAESA